MQGWVRFTSIKPSFWKVTKERENQCTQAISQNFLSSFHELWQIQKEKGNACNMRQKAHKNSNNVLKTGKKI